MAEIIYLLCALTAIACAWLLLRNYFKTGGRLLLWSGLCFAGMSLNNLFLVMDKLLLFPNIDLSIWRLLAGLVAMLLLLYGLIWENE
ncbi:MAG: DUF5985 family protein [Thiobacillus sp.]